MRNELKNTAKISKTFPAIGGAILIGAIALIGACSSAKTETSAANSLANAPAIAINKPATNASPEKTIAVNPTNGIMPTAMTDAGEFAENIYDYAKAKDWAKVEQKRAALEKSINELKTDRLDTPQIGETSGLIDKAVKEKKRD